MNHPRIMLIGVDGVRVEDALAGAMPRLADFVAGGELAEMTMEVPTISGPGWTSLLCGIPHREHAVVDNTFLAHTIPPLSDLLSRAVHDFPGSKTYAASSWAPLVDPVGPAPVIAWRAEYQRIFEHRVIVRDGETYGYRTTDAEIGAFSNHAVRDGDVHAAFVYFGEVDEAGHVHGGLSPEYDQAMLRVDAHVGALVDTVAERAERTGEDWVVAITTDHGHLDDGGHGGDEPVVRRSFCAARAFGPDVGRSLGLGERIEPWQVAPWLLEQRRGRSDV